MGRGRDLSVLVRGTSAPGSNQGKGGHCSCFSKEETMQGSAWEAEKANKGL